jgi:organic hydroperoxide reductase OsmC/OhrA
MDTYSAQIRWQRGAAVFTDHHYSRVHDWLFDGGAKVQGSSSPHSVPPPLSDPAAVDPEEALIAATASCHMLWFLSIAAKRGYIVDSYVDDAFGVMEKDHRGRMAITRISLRPRIVFGGERLPDETQLATLHQDAHEQCYIANSLRTEVVVAAPPKATWRD